MDDPSYKPAQIVVRSKGITKTEDYLGQLCEKSFLSRWSYPAIFRDQGGGGEAGHGKEVCDLLVVFGRHIIIFSDKECPCGNGPDLRLEWSRWFRKAVVKSMNQVVGAERWIRSYPERLFLDRACRMRFPLVLPPSQDAIFHRIVVAHGISQQCQRVLGGSGSLRINTSIRGNEHLENPFSIGLLDEKFGYIHVLDDNTLAIVLGKLDTVSDFVNYLAKKEKLLCTDRFIVAAGEEELLANYLGTLNAHGEHDFDAPEHADVINFEAGQWARFLKSHERMAQVRADRISYAWDRLIEVFATHLMGGTQYYTTRPDISDQEVGFRLMGRESRTRRRMLARAILDLIDKNPNSRLAARVVAPSGPEDPHYIFLLARRRQDVTEEDYRRFRFNLLALYCKVVRLKFPEAKHVVGIATEPGRDSKRSEDFVHFDCSGWNSTLEEEAKKAQAEFGLLTIVKESVGKEHEYPVNAYSRPGPSRNSTCICGSGKYKRCCGRGRFKKKASHGA